MEQQAYAADLLLSPGQWLSIPFIIAGSSLLVRVWKGTLLAN